VSSFINCCFHQLESVRNHCCHESASGTVVFQSEENDMLELIKKQLFHVPATVAIQSRENVMLQVKEILF
jgi:hypothetical protein